MKKLLAAAVMMFFFSIVCVYTPAFATDREPGVYLAQQSQGEAAEEDEDEDDEYDDEYEDDVVQINDPLYRLNHEFYLFNDAMYVAIIRPAAKGYNTVIPEEIRISVKNFFYNLRFPIRFVNCLLQAKGTKAMEEFATFFSELHRRFCGHPDAGFLLRESAAQSRGPGSDTRGLGSRQRVFHYVSDFRTVQSA